MIGGGDQHPARAGAKLARLAELLLEEHRVLVSVARIRFEDQLLARNAERGEQRRGPRGFAVGLVEDSGIATGKGDLGLREAPREHRGLDDALAGLVQRRRMPRRADQPILYAAEQDEAGGCRWRVEIGAREAVLER